MDIKAKKIILKAKKQVFSGMFGSHSSLFKGQGFDFMELREYQDGDDVKHIDWIVTAKKHKPFVKIFHEQRQLNMMLMPILTGSLYFGTKALKYEVVAKIYAILGFVGIENAHRCSSLLPKRKSYIQPLKNRFELERDIDYLLGYDYFGSSGSLDSIKKLKLPKSLLFMIGDFVGDIDISHLSKKHDLVALIVRDRFEQKPEDLGVINAIDPNSNKVSQLSFSKEFAASYAKTIKQNDQKLYAHFRTHKVRFIKIYTDEDPYLKLLQLH